MDIRKKGKSDNLSMHIDLSSFLVEQCVAGVNEEEFLFYSRLAISVGQLQTPLPQSNEYDIHLFDGRSEFSNVRFSGDALNRMLIALIENMDENEREEKLPAIGTRLFALIDLINGGKLDKWATPTSDDNSILISESVFRAAATVAIGENLQFIWKEFEQKLQEISKAESNIEQHNRQNM